MEIYGDTFPMTWVKLQLWGFDRGSQVKPPTMFGDAVGLMYSLKTPTINQSIPTGQPCGASSIPQDFGA